MQNGKQGYPDIIKHCTDKQSRTQQLLNIRIKVYTCSDKRLHKADVFSVIRFEMMLCSGYVVEKVGGYEQKMIEFFVCFVCVVSFFSCIVQLNVKSFPN